MGLGFRSLGPVWFRGLVLRALALLVEALGLQAFFWGLRCSSGSGFGRRFRGQGLGFFGLGFSLLTV